MPENPASYRVVRKKSYLFNKAPLPANSAGGQMTWRFINDYGAVSDPIKMTL
ncbi:hypothetical protein IGA36_002568 [Escherichia coli]|nr:hypothetical protein [Escherichia coli]